MEQQIDRVLHQRYQIQSLLGRQTGRRTFLAKDLQTDAQVVIKLLLFGPDFTWENLKLFEREAETLRVLKHDFIPEYLDSFEVEMELGKGFALVQNYIEARSLKDWVEGGRSFSEAELKAIAKELLEILIYLHDRKPPVIHRDIKPSNILLRDRTGNTPGKVYLVDFGSVQTAIHSGTMTVVGTYGYMPPEQFGGRATALSDLYSLGATIIYLATGQHPAALLTDDLRLEFQHSTQLSTPLTDWLGRMVQSAPSQRFTSAQDALQALNNPQFKESSLHQTPVSSLERFAPPEFAHCVVKKDSEKILITAPVSFRFSRISICLAIGFFFFPPILGLNDLILLNIFRIVTILAFIQSILQDKGNSVSHKVILRIDTNKISLWVQNKENPQKNQCIKQSSRANIRKIQIVNKKQKYHVKLATGYSYQDDFFVGNRIYWLSQKEAEWLANELSIWLEIPVTEVQVFN